MISPTPHCLPRWRDLATRTSIPTSLTRPLCCAGDWHVNHPLPDGNKRAAWCFDPVTPQAQSFFRNRRVVADRLLAEGANVVAFCKWSATVASESFPAPTGSLLERNVISLFVVEA